MEVKIKTSILKVLAYFDLFNHPVSKEEIYLFLDRPVRGDELTIGLAQLVSDGHVFKLREFYSLKNDMTLLKKRINENAYAQSLLITARQISEFLFRFPYVKGVGISGSLSKNVADETSDIDYFIITSSNRLWIARTIMHLFKKLTFITGHQHWYCMNYYVDEDAMQIEEKNIFTATELVTLLPICGNGTMHNFFKLNEWTNIYFPNFRQKTTDQPGKVFHNRIKKLVEFFFNNKMGDRLDNYLMGLTKKRWTQKEEEQKLNVKGNRMGLSVSKHCCKPNPAFFHANILRKYASRLTEIENQYNNASGEWRVASGY